MTDGQTTMLVLIFIGLAEMMKAAVDGRPAEGGRHWEQPRERVVYERTVEPEDDRWCVPISATLGWKACW